jgi:hypothetical protein
LKQWFESITLEKFLKKFKKSIDKIQKLCYNKYNERKKEVIIMERYTQKELRKLVASGVATDITNAHDYNAVPKPYDVVGYSKGIYGCNGKLLKDENGRLYAIIGATSALYMF